LLRLKDLVSSAFKRRLLSVALDCL